MYNNSVSCNHLVFKSLNTSRSLLGRTCGEERSQESSMCRDRDLEENVTYPGDCKVGAHATWWEGGDESGNTGENQILKDSGSYPMKWGSYSVTRGELGLHDQKSGKLRYGRAMKGCFFKDHSGFYASDEWRRLKPATRATALGLDSGWNVMGLEIWQRQLQCRKNNSLKSPGRRDH